MAKIKLHNPELAVNSVFKNLVIESFTADPTVSGVQNSGRIWFNNADKVFKGTFLNEASTDIEIKAIGIDNSAEVDALEVLVTTNTTNITNNTTNIGTNTTDIASNTTAIDVNTTDIATEVTDRTNADATLQGEIDTVETDLVTNYLNKTTTTAQAVTADTTFSGNLHIQGDLVVSGASTIVETEILKVADNIITLNNGIGAVAPTENAGLEVDRGTEGVSTIIQWNETADQVEVLEDGVLRKVATTTYVDGEIATASGDISSLDTRLTTAEGNITSNDTDIATNSTNIATEITNRVNADTNIQAELDATQVGAGLGVDGSYTADVLTNFITTATDLANADKLLDGQIKTNADAIGVLDTRVSTVENEVNGNIGDLSTLTTTEKGTIVGAINEVDTNIDTEVTNRTTADNTLQSNIGTEIQNRTNADTDLGTRIDNVNTAAGITGDAYTANAGSNYLTATTSLVDADNKLDATIKLNLDNLAATDANLGTNLVGYEGYTEADTNIVNPTIEAGAGTLKATIDTIASLVNTKIHDLENKYVKGEVADADKSDTYTLAHNLDTEFVDVSVQVYDVEEAVWRFDLVVTEVIDANVVKISLASGTAEQIRYVIQGY